MLRCFTSGSMSLEKQADGRILSSANSWPKGLRLLSTAHNCLKAAQDSIKRSSAVPQNRFKPIKTTKTANI
eukprot:4969336-Alexandrium_andersonii.AAC.1